MQSNAEPALLKSTAGDVMALTGVTATGRVTGLLLELAVEQRYRNASDTNVEAVYTFPLPFDAVLLDLEIRLGERALRAIAVERAEAEARYEGALEKGDTAVMLERGSDGLCTLNLGNLMAGESATIRYTYAQLLRVTHGSVRIAVPTVIAPRYGDPGDAGLAPHQVPLNDLALAYPFALTLALEGDIAQGSIESPSHPIASVRTETGINVTLARDGYLDRDFVLDIADLAGRSLATLVRDGEGGAHVALASFVAAVPAALAEAPLALKLLLDCSGSMGGDSIGAAKRALHAILASLVPADRVTLSRFGSRAQHLLPQFECATAAIVRRAADWVSAIDADLGGTEMEAALREVFAFASGSKEGADVLVITDGEVFGADKLVAAARRAKQRVFVVGIGSAPAEGVLRALADATGGACEFVAPNEDAEAAILRMFARLRAPRIARVDVAWPQTPAWTTPLPSALFGGETIHVFAGFDAPPAGAITLRMLPHGDQPPLVATATLPGPCDAQALPRIAAARRIEHADAASALALALQYGLLTDRTNFIVVADRAEAEKARDLPALQRIAQMHAAGWGGIGSVKEACVASSMMHSVERHVFEPGMMLDFLPSMRMPAPSGTFDNIQFRSTISGAIDDAAEYLTRSSGQDALIDNLARHLPLIGRARLPSTIAALCRRGLDESTADVLRRLVADGHRGSRRRARVPRVPRRAAGGGREIPAAAARAARAVSRCGRMRGAAEGFAGEDRAERGAGVLTRNAVRAESGRASGPSSGRAPR